MPRLRATDAEASSRLPFSSSTPGQHHPADAPCHRRNLEQTMTTILLLKLIALTYVGLLAAGLLMPGVVGMRNHLRTMPEFIRKLFWVYYTFIGLCLIAFGTGTFFFA